MEFTTSLLATVIVDQIANKANSEPIVFSNSLSLHMLSAVACIINFHCIIILYDAIWPPVKIFNNEKFSRLQILHVV